jgi:very-short-patch-repair endonuclease
MWMEEIKKQFARSLRQNQTETEKIVWNLLRNKGLYGLKFRRQHVIEGFVVDFYCHEYKLALEIDGKVHEKQKEYDTLRETIIANKGISFIRMKNEDIQNNIEMIKEKIKERIME